MDLFLDLCKLFFFIFGILDKKSVCEINLCSFYDMSFEIVGLVDFLK